MAKRVKMIFASLVADILFSSHVFLQWKPGHSLANRSPLVGELCHMSLLIPAVVSQPKPDRWFVLGGALPAGYVRFSRLT